MKHLLKHFNIIVIGGGAAGFFTAINAAENNPDLSIAILERGKDFLTKVKISGGGRCNVTHAEFLPKELTKNYPRGEKELLGPFHGFMTGDTIAWFADRGIELKIEEDGRMFPISDSSQTIIDCFISETKRLNIKILTNHSVKEISRIDDMFQIITASEAFSADKIVIATGSNPKIWQLLENLGHNIIDPVPSLFTFNIKDERIIDLPGIATEVSLKVISGNYTLLESEGPLLITHWGMSGPAILKLSAWGARLLEPTKYNFTLQINWLLYASEDETIENLKHLKILLAKKTVLKNPQFELSKRLWHNLMRAVGLDEAKKWAELSNIDLANIAAQLTKCQFTVNGKSTFKEEFVTAGGIDLKEVNFKTFESKIHSGLFFAGEILNIDAITGGFNFQNAWTSGFLAAKAISEKR